MPVIRKKISLKRGFTLIELLVVMAIFVIITAIVLARQNKFSSDIVLTDLAYQVAISIRQAQVYGLGVRASAPGSDITKYETGYGVHFTSPPTSYKFFADANKSGLGESDEISSNTTITYGLTNGAKISSVCAFSGGSGGFGQNIPPECVGSAINYLDLIYIRPDPSALITSNHSSNRNDGPPYILPPLGTYNSATITIVSALGDRVKCINVYQTGQISVVNPPAGKNVCPQP